MSSIKKEFGKVEVVVKNVGYVVYVAFEAMSDEII